jgi:alpha-tubulin suppressor-like RCC1 family protein
MRLFLLLLLPIAAQAAVPTFQQGRWSQRSTLSFASSQAVAGCAQALPFTCRAVVWGEISKGGSQADLPAKLKSSETPIAKVFASDGAFAVLHTDGSVTAHGVATAGGTGVPAAVSSPTSPIINIASASISNTGAAFAALHQDGHVSAWGLNQLIQLPTSVTSPSSAVVSIASNRDGFAALHANGVVSSWGNSASNSGIDQLNLPSAVTSPTSPVVSIHPTYQNFVALHQDGMQCAPRSLAPSLPRSLAPSLL